MAERPHEAPKVGFELDTYEVSLLRVPAGPHRHDPAAVERLEGEHLSYLFGLQAAGDLLAAGAITGHPSLLGVGFYRKGSLEEARRLAAADPGVEAGLYELEVVTFLCPKGALRFAADAG